MEQSIGIFFPLFRIINGQFLWALADPIGWLGDFSHQFESRTLITLILDDGERTLELDNNEHLHLRNNNIQSTIHHNNGRARDNKNHLKIKLDIPFMVKAISKSNV